MSTLLLLKKKEIVFDHKYLLEIYIPNKSAWYQIQKSYEKILSLHDFLFLYVTPDDK